MTVETTTALCSSCRTTKPLSDFYLDRARWNGATSACKSCTLKRASKYREDNHEHCKKRDRDNYWKNRERNLARDRARYWADPEKARARVVAWQKANPQKHADTEARRRARQRSANVVEKIDRAALYERDGGRCHVCNKKVPARKFELDHLVPLALGGDHCATNLRVAHRSCNAKRNWGQIPAQLLLVG